MALYFYQALSKSGKKISGVMDAASVQEVKAKLVQQTFYPIMVEPARQETQYSFLRRLTMGKVTIKEKILFTKQLGVLLKSGIPLLQTLELLTDQFTKSAFHPILIAIKDEIKEGKSLAEALSRYPKIFENVYIQLVRAGEASGKLEVILERLTIYIERQEEMRKRVKSAISYPLFQLGFAVVVVIVMMVFVVPKIVETMLSMGQKELPLPTRMLMGMADFVKAYIVYLIIAIIAAVIGFKYWKATPKGAKSIDNIKLKMPIVGFFSRMGAVVQFCQTLGMLLESGVNLSEALDIVVKIIDNRVLKDTLNEARDKIIKQGKIAQYLKQTDLFPPIAIYLIKTGEESGQLDAMLLTVARNYEVEVREAADGLSAKITPIMLIFMAIMVGFIVAAIALPIMNMMGGESM